MEKTQGKRGPHLWDVHVDVETMCIEQIKKVCSVKPETHTGQRIRRRSGGRSSCMHLSGAASSQLANGDIQRA